GYSSYFGWKYPLGPERMHFYELHGRLLAALRDRVENGELSERRLARLTGISQPHMHNVLKGKRILSNRAADIICLRLGLSVTDLLGRDELASAKRTPPGTEQDRLVEVPVLEGRLGPGLPLPHKRGRLEQYPFLRSSLASVEAPVMARLAHDHRIAGMFREGDLVLLDVTVSRRLNPERGEFFVINRHGEGIVRHIRRHRSDLLELRGVTPDGLTPAEALPLGGNHLLDVVRARIAWVGRSLPPHGPFGPSAT
ncbi:MAG TPA: helix-turn-helix transcriptional regulator, partial [Bryobacteraceae bacterium]|nr:helix-turn-helix transcriptional regulator [Bryobacteraceae bacterium]